MISDLLPYTRDIADDLCLIQDDAHRARESRSRVEVPAHGFPDRGPAFGRRLGQLRARLRQSGSADVRRHELGAARTACRSTRSTWGSGFLPSHYQGVLFRSGDDPGSVHRQPDGLTSKDRREMLDAISRRWRCCSTSVERSGDPIEGQPVRDVVPDADVGARGRGHLE